MRLCVCGFVASASLHDSDSVTRCELTCHKSPCMCLDSRVAGGDRVTYDGVSLFVELRESKSGHSNIIISQILGTSIFVSGSYRCSEFSGTENRVPEARETG